MASSPQLLLHDFPPFFRVHTDGRIERLFTSPRLPPSTDLTTGVQTKDILISPHHQTKSRIFLPKLNPPQKLPLVIYIHGGAFCIGSPLNTITHNFLTPLVSQTPLVAVAVGYRLAPENPLPTAYHDCWDAFHWINFHATGSGPDPWINEYVDFTRVFLVGESAGANLAHYVAVRVGVSKPGLGIRGLVTLHPYFSRKESDKMIQYLYPGSFGSDDDPKLNPRADPDLEKLGCLRVLITVAENDFLRERGVDYEETLKKSKWEGSVEFVENEGEGHCFYLFKPTSEKAKGVIQMLISFENRAR